MLIRDDAMWAQTKAELSSDGELGLAFIAFVVDWCETAEHAIETSQEFLQQDGTWSGEIDPAQALRDALPAVEFRAGEGGVSLSILAQGMVAIMGVWQYGPEVFKNLTVIESKIVGDMLAIKYQELMAAAEVASNVAKN